MKSIFKLILISILFFSLLFSEPRCGSHPTSLVPIIFVPYPFINTTINKPFTLTFIVIDDDPYKFFLKSTDGVDKSGRIRSRVLNFTYSLETAGTIVYTLTISDFSNNRVSEDITVTVTYSNQGVGDLGHTFEEEYFAVEIDLVGSGSDVFDPDPKDPDLINDLLDLGGMTGDSNPLEDEQFYLAYMNMSGIQTAFSALEKFEHTLAFKDFISDEMYQDIWDIGALTPSIRNALAIPISHVNATAPFQQLVQHYNTPAGDGFKDVFVTNNFMALIAYSTGTGSDPYLMDGNDDLFLGYTFIIQNLTNVINKALIENGHNENQIKNYDFESSFEKTERGYKFGIKYSNILVLWYDIDVAPKVIDVFTSSDDHSFFLTEDTRGVAFGSEVVGLSVLEHITFNYSYETAIYSGANEYIEGRVTTNYDIGETIAFASRDNSSIISDYLETWTNNPFMANLTYSLPIPDELADFDFSYYGLPNVQNEVIVEFPELAFFINEDAKKRLRMENGLGLTVVTSTTSFGIDVLNPVYEQVGDDIIINMGDRTYFYTEFTDKRTYRLRGLEELWPEMSPETDWDVQIIPFDPIGWGVADFGITKAYFVIEFGLAYEFTKFMAKDIGEFIQMPPSAAAYLSADLLYFTFTEFPEWYGGEIIHDPTYSAVAAMAAEPPESSSREESSEAPATPSNGVPGFKRILPILGVLALLAWKKSKKGKYQFS
ncbi:MAG: hypothetical protein ACFFDC_04150 [Promethearchaeota archaeon]